jgi:epoxyqueuosine reductase
LRLLLHVCCAPCAIGVAEESAKDKLTVTGYFYNPNIHPISEYIKRKNEAQKYFDSKRLNFIAEEYNPDTFFRSIDCDRKEPSRCVKCWDLRMKKTASFTEENKFNFFTTTLLASPYQDHGVIKDICEKVSDEKFYYKDFRKSFTEGHKKARAIGLYCQNYCGCIFSLIEREERKKSKKACA